MKASLASASLMKYFDNVYLTLSKLQTPPLTDMRVILILIHEKLYENRQKLGRSKDMIE